MQKSRPANTLILDHLFSFWISKLQNWKLMSLSFFKTLSGNILLQPWDQCHNHLFRDDISNIKESKRSAGNKKLEEEVKTVEKKGRRKLTVIG